MGCCVIFFSLMCKNFKTELRSWLGLIIIIVTSIVISVTASSDMFVAHPREKDSFDGNLTLYSRKLSVSDETPINFHNIKWQEYGLAYCPANNVIGKYIANDIKEQLNLKHIVPFEDFKEMENNFDQKTLIAGLSFKNGSPNILNVKLHFPATLRSKKTEMSIKYKLWKERCPACSINDKDFGKLSTIYQEEGFLDLQDAIFRAWYKFLIKSGNNTHNLPELPNYSVMVRSYRYDKQITCEQTKWGLTPMFLLSFLFLYPFCHIIWKIGREAEQDIMVNHWQYSCPLFLHYFAHFIASLPRLLLVDVIFLINLKIPWNVETVNRFDQDAMLLFFAFLVLFNVALIIVAFFLATIIQNAKTSVVIGITLWMIFFCISFAPVIADHMDTMKYLYISTVIFFNSAVPVAFHNIMYHDAYDMNNLFLCVFGNILIYLFVWTISQIYLPFRYLDKESFSLFRYIKNRKDKSYSKYLSNVARPEQQTNGLFDADKKSFLCCRNIVITRRRRFSSAKLVFVRNVSMDFYEGEISVLLGPHGSGKTCLIRLFSGLLQPDHGYVYYQEQVLSKNWCKLHQYCDSLMKTNPYFDYLTVQETIRYFIAIKGSNYSNEKQHDEIKKWTAYMTPVVNNTSTLVKNLNFQQQRLLGLCTVMCCGTAIVLLDEPTLHLRNAEQNFFWNILKENKAKRTIIIATVDMDTAESIGDRIAFISRGNLLSFDSAMNLKNNLRNSFQLMVSIEHETSSEPITAFLNGLNSTIVLHSAGDDQLIYRIPITDSKDNQKILIEVNKNAKDLGIKKVQILDFSFNEVMCQLNKKNSDGEDYKTYLTGLLSPFQATTQTQKKCRQFSAIFLLRLYHQSLLAALAIIILTTLTIFYLNFIMPKMDIDVNDDNSTMLNSLLRMNSNPTLDLINFDNCSYINLYPTKRGNELTANCKKFDLHDALTYGSDILEYGALQNGINNTNKKTLWVNQQTFHSAPMVLNLLHNQILRNSFPDDNNILIRQTSEPFEPRVEEKIELRSGSGNDLVHSVAIGSVWPLLWAIPIVFLANNRINNIYICFEVAGLLAPIYWTAIFLWDFIGNFFCSLVLIALTALITMNMSIAFKSVAAFIMIIAAIPIIWFTYFMSIFMKHSPCRSYFYAVLFHLIFGCFLFNFYVELTEFNETVRYLLSFAPQFALLDALCYIDATAAYDSICKDSCKKKKDCNVNNICESIPACCSYDAASLFSWKNKQILITLIYFFASSIIFIAATGLVLLRRRDRKYQVPPSAHNYRSYYYDNDDANVVSLRKYIASLGTSQCKRLRVCVDQLEKELPKNEVRIKTLSFNVDKGSCLCIFGCHHSDKTHLAKQLSGEVGFHFGEIYMRGMDFRRNLQNARQILGYCPQFGGTTSRLTVYQIFLIHYMIRGLTRTDAKPKISFLVNVLGLKNILNRKIWDLSYSEARKTAIGISLIAANKILIFDEPTRGVSGSAKWDIWNIIKSLRNEGRAIIVLTADSNECKTVSNYVLVMDKYDALSYGNMQSIVEKNSMGFIVKLQLNSDGETPEIKKQNLEKDIENAERMVLFFHENSKEIYRLDNIIYFYCPVQHINFVHIYGVIEKNKNLMNIVDYSVELPPMSDILARLNRDGAVLKTDKSGKVRK